MGRAILTGSSLSSSAYPDIDVVAEGGGYSHRDGTPLRSLRRVQLV